MCAAHLIQQSDMHKTASAADGREDLPFPHEHFRLKNRLETWVSVYLFDGVTYTVRRGLLKGMKRKGGLAWIPCLLSEDRLNAEDQFLCGLDLDGATVYDVGACQGLVTLFFAVRAKTVVCFEPNAQNRQRLRENLALNGVQNVEIRKQGVGSRRETRKMVGSPLLRGIASVDDKSVEEFSRRWAKPLVEEIPITTLDQEIAEAGLAAPDFIKIDIEGWELEALQGATQTLESSKPALFMEMHGETVREKKSKVAAIVDFLWQQNYRSIRHVETGLLIAPENSYLAMEGHLYCSAG